MLHEHLEQLHDQVNLDEHCTIKRLRDFWHGLYHCWELGGHNLFSTLETIGSANLYEFPTALISGNCVFFGSEMLA